MVFDREAVWKEALRDGLHRVLADLREPATEVRAHFLRVVASGVTESWQQRRRDRVSGAASGAGDRVGSAFPRIRRNPGQPGISPD